MSGRSTTVSAVSSVATALATAQGTEIVITVDDVRRHMEWLHDPLPIVSPLPKERVKFISMAMDFLLSDDAPRA